MHQWPLPGCAAAPAACNRWLVCYEWNLTLNELKNRRLEDILIAVVDGRRGFPETIDPRGVQRCL